MAIETKLPVDRYKYAVFTTRLSHISTGTLSTVIEYNQSICNKRQETHVEIFTGVLLRLVPSWVEVTNSRAEISRDQIPAYTATNLNLLHTLATSTQQNCKFRF